MKISNRYIIGLNYHNRIFIGLAVVLLFTILVFNYVRPTVIIVADIGVERDDAPIETVSITRHTPENVPRPPRPVIHPIQFADVIIEDEFDIDSIEFSLDPIETPPAASTADNVEHSPDRAARVVRIVEAITPAAIRDSDNRFEVIVTLLVSSEGNVDEVFITEIRMYDSSGGYEVIEDAGHGLIQETIRAASGWRFIPARKDGQPVNSYSRHRFTFGAQS